MEHTFVYKKFVTGKNFIGRKTDVTILSNLMLAAENVTMYEPPKSGITSAIQQAAFNMRIQGKSFFTSEMDLTNVRSISGFLKKFGDSVIRMVATTPDEYADLVGRLLMNTHFVFDREAYSENDEIISLNWDVDDNDISSMLSLPYRLAVEYKTQVFVIINEFQNVFMTENGEKICKIFEKVIKEERASMNVPCSFVFCGSQVNAMKQIFEHVRFFYRQVEHVSLSRIEDKDLIDYIVKGLLANGKVIDRDLLLGVSRLFDGHPYYINHFIAICDSLSKGYIMEPILIDALSMLIAVHEPEFKARMFDLTTFQVSLLKAVVDGHTKFSSTEVIEKYALNSSANVRRLKDALCKKELITFDEKDEPHILDPLFAYWVKKFYFEIKEA